MFLIIRLMPQGRCTGCAAVGYVCQRTLLCLTCLDLKIKVSTRKQKLTSTLAGRFAHMGEKIRRQLAELRN
jgi:hypothetical protein